MNKFVVKMLELGAEFDKAVSPIEINMVLNDAEILYKNHIKQLTIPKISNQLCDCKDFEIKGKMLVCKDCGKEHKSLSA